jgi:heme exporter protein B
MFDSLTTIIGCELRKTIRNYSESVYSLLFFTMALILFPFALGADITILSKVISAAIWVSALFSMSLSLDVLYRTDYTDGTIENIVLSGTPLALVGIGKSISHWILSAAPIVIIAIPIGLSLDLNAGVLHTLVVALALCTATISLIGGAICALTAGLRGSAVLLTILLIPTYCPLIIFGASATSNAALGLDVSGEFYFLSGILLLAFCLAPWATSCSLRARLS